MKNRFEKIIALLALVGLFLPSLQAQGLDEENGFMGYQLGVHMDSVNRTQLQRRGKVQKLVRWDVLKEHISIDGLDLNYVRLFFWKEKIHSIDVKSAPGSGNQLREWVFAKYGKGFQEDAMGYKFSWEGEHLRLFMEQNLVTKDVKLSFLCDEVHNKYYKFMYERDYGSQ